MEITNQFAGSTYLTPISALFLIIASLYIFLGSKKNNILIPYILAICFVSYNLRVVLAGIDFSVIRFMTTAGYLRIILKKEYKNFHWIKLDRLLVAYLIVNCTANIIREHNSSVVIYMLGTSLDSVGTYFLIRLIVKDKKMIIDSIKLLLYISIPLSLFFVFEKRTQINLFSYIGGVPYLSPERQGEIRARAAFAHPINAGAFWAACIPLFIGIRKEFKSNFVIIISFICSLTIIFACSSSTPLMSFAAGFCFLLLYKFRGLLSKMKGALVILLIILQLGMESPIWFLIARIDLTGGSTGYFRAVLIDQFVRNIKQWFLVGVSSTYSWGASYNFAAAGLADVANQYVATGVSGGIALFVIFIMIITLLFRYLGKMIYDYSANNKKESFFYWCYTASIVTHLFNFIGLTYFGQIITFWWINLAFIAILYQFETHEELMSGNENYKNR